MSQRRDEVLNEHRDAIRRAAFHHKADSIALIGSVARGDDTSDSDYDFLARFGKGASLFDLAGLKLALQDLLGRDVDVISSGSLKERHRKMVDEAIAL